LNQNAIVTIHLRRVGPRTTVPVKAFGPAFGKQRHAIEIRIAIPSLPKSETQPACDSVQLGLIRSEQQVNRASQCQSVESTAKQSSMP